MSEASRLGFVVPLRTPGDECLVRHSFVGVAGKCRFDLETLINYGDPRPAVVGLAVNFELQSHIAVRDVGPFAVSIYDKERRPEGRLCVLQTGTVLRRVALTMTSAAGVAPAGMPG